MKKGTPWDACDYCIYENLSVIPIVALTGVFVVIAVPFEVVHLVLLYNLILTDPVVLLRVITGSKFAGVKPLYAPPAELAFVYALPSTVLIVNVPPVISADEAVMTLPTGIQIVISFELLACQQEYRSLYPLSC